MTPNIAKTRTLSSPYRLLVTTITLCGSLGVALAQQAAPAPKKDAPPAASAQGGKMETTPSGLKYTDRKSVV